MARKSTPPAARRTSAPATDWVDGNLWLLGRECPGVDMSGSQITARIFRLREIYVAHLDAVHRRFGLKPRMFLVLAALYRSGAPYRLTPASLTRHLMWSSGGLAQLLDRMENEGLIRRLKEKGVRGVQVCLQPKGRRLIAELIAIHCAAEHTLFAHLRKSEFETLVGLLRKLLLAADGPRPLALPAHARPKAVRR